MPVGIVPESFLGLLAAFAGCFTAPSYRTFELLVVGWVHCLGRRTITAVALASDAAGSHVHPEAAAGHDRRALPDRPW